MLSAPTANAIPMTSTADLSGANELPNPVPSPGTGLATVVLVRRPKRLQITATFSGLTHHYYGGAHPLLRAVRHERRCRHHNTCVSRVPSVGTSGTYSSPVFDLTQPLIYNSAFVAMFPGGIPQGPRRR